MSDATLGSGRTRRVGDAAVVYATDYLNRLTGERIERECRSELQAGCRVLVINFKDTQLVNSIGVSILMGVIDAARESNARLVFSGVNHQNTRLFEMLGLTRHVDLSSDEDSLLNGLDAWAPADSFNRGNS